LNILVLLISVSAVAQQKKQGYVIVSGTVYDISARLPIEAVTVFSTNGNGTYTDSVVDTITYYERIWTTLADAQEWINFVPTLDTPPASAVILP
jgi:hypothetical protein